MTAAEQAILEAAYAEVKQTTLSWDAWLRRMIGVAASRTGRTLTGTEIGHIIEDARSSHWYKAGAQLESLKHLKAGAGTPTGSGSGGVTLPPPAPSTLSALIQNVVYGAWDPASALNAPAHWKIAWTADVHVEISPDETPEKRAAAAAAYVQKVKDAAKVAKDRGQKIGVWGNQVQIGADAIRDLGAQIGADFLIYQGETEQEFDAAFQVGAKLLVGNANAWTDAQRRVAADLIAHGQLAFAQEAYTNLGNPWPDQTSTQGVPAASLVVATYDGSDEVPGRGWHPTLADYKLHTPPSVWPTISIYHGASVQDWETLA